MRRKAEMNLQLTDGESAHGVHDFFRFPAFAADLKFGLSGLQRTVATVRQDDAGARAVLHELPGVGLEIDRRGSLAGRARPSRAIVLALEGDAEALFLMSGDGSIAFGLRQRGGKGDRSQRSRHSTGEDGRAHNGSHRHNVLQIGGSLHPVVGMHWAYGPGGLIVTEHNSH